MLIGFVIAYIMVSVAIELLATKRVHHVKDDALAGRNLPLLVVIITVIGAVFATWFGTELVWRISDLCTNMQVQYL